MRGWLLDTNVVSEFRRQRCDPGVRRWAEAQEPERCYLSIVTMAEIRFGIEQLADARRRDEIAAWLDGVLRPWFRDRVPPLDEDVLLEWRRLVARGRARGVTFSQPDLFIAAKASLHQLGVATRNARNFRHTGAVVVDPWTGQTQGPD